jgi:hypothetical protein
VTDDLPVIPDGPVERMPAGFATASEREAILRQVLGDAGVQLGAYDEVTVRWLATGPDWWTFATVVSWIQRAAEPTWPPRQCRIPHRANH